MPKSVQYNANSIVYFKGDTNENVYILKTGRVSLKYNDIETGQEINDLIQTGEFFSVKSSLGKYPKEETAVVLQDSQLIVFSVPEFEQLAMANTRIIMKMLRVFSNQLRRIHKQVQNLLSSGEQQKPEEGLLSIGEYYLKSGKLPQSLYAFRRYLTYYPDGKYAAEATDNIQNIEARLQTGGGGAHTSSNFASSSSSGTASSGLSDVAKSYYNAVSLFSQQKYGDALVQFRKISQEGGDQEYLAKSLFEMGRCYFSLNDFDKCISHYTGMIQKYPKHPDIVEALYYVGASYEKKDVTDKASSFYKKILTMAEDGSPIQRKATRALKGLEG
ncbi:MAG: tetratricopeptide repeat protein [Spirochaetales bacterium]|nr:tetratricopeptide repeat protein [Spirochaetales bacterium]